MSNDTFLTKAKHVFKQSVAWIKKTYQTMVDFLKSDKLKKMVFGHSAANGLIGKLAVYALLIGISYVFLFPILRMISMSFMTRADLLDPEVSWIPSRLSFSNFIVANRVLGLLPPSLIAEGLSFGERIGGIFTNPGNLFKSIRNVFILASIQTVITAFAGFAFARFNFKFKNFWFTMVLLSFIIPLPMVTIPRIMLFSNLQDKVWIPIFETLFMDTFLDGIIKRTLFQTLYPQVILALFGQGINSAILILIFYNFFKMIPVSLDEAARVDGAKSLQVFWYIYVKLVVPIIIIVFLFAFIWNWNDIYTATIFFNSGNPLIVSRLALFDSQFAGQAGSNPDDAGIALINEGYKTAATFLSILPLLILYLLAQRKFIEGIERTGMTGE